MQVRDNPLPGGEADAEQPGLAGDAPRWYLLQTKAGQESRAEQNLVNQDYHCFCPRMQVEAIRQGRRELRTEVMFPGYLFIRLQKGRENWGPLRSTRGVLRMVSFDGTPMPVPDEIVETLRRGGADNSQTPPAAFQPGDKLRVKTGPFAELQAVFECFDGQERVVILLNLLHRQHRLKIPLGHVSKED